MLKYHDTNKSDHVILIKIVKSLGTFKISVIRRLMKILKILIVYVVAVKLLNIK